MRLIMEPRYWEIVEHIIAKYPYTIAAFGSRVKGVPRQFSDLDLCIMEPVSDVVLGDIKEDFTESNLPFTVDVIAWHNCSDEFKKHIENDLYVLKSLQADE